MQKYEKRGTKSALFMSNKSGKKLFLKTTFLLIENYNAACSCFTQFAIRSSVLSDDTKKNCPITSESLKAHMAWEEGPFGRGKYIMRQIAVVSILGAIGCAVASPIVKSKQNKKSEK